MKTDKSRAFRLIIILSIVLFLNLGIVSQNPVINNEDKTQLNDENQLLVEPQSQTMDEDNEYSGVGSPWNLTHWANRTDYNVDVSFQEGSNDTIGIPFGADWEGYKLNTSVYDLYDTRNC